MAGPGTKLPLHGAHLASCATKFAQRGAFTGSPATKFAQRSPYYSVFAKKLAQHATNRRFWAIFRALGELFRAFAHHQTKQGELCTARGAGAGTKLSQHAASASPTGTKLSRHIGLAGPTGTKLSLHAASASPTGTKLSQHIGLAGPTGTKLSQHAASAGQTGTKLSRLAIKRLFWTVFRMRGEFCHARATNRPRREKKVTHQHSPRPTNVNLPQFRT